MAAPHSPYDPDEQGAGANALQDPAPVPWALHDDTVPSSDQEQNMPSSAVLSNPYDVVPCPSPPARRPVGAGALLALAGAVAAASPAAAYDPGFDLAVPDFATVVAAGFPEPPVERYDVAQLVLPGFLQQYQDDYDRARTDVIERVTGQRPTFTDVGENADGSRSYQIDSPDWFGPTDHGWYHNPDGSTTGVLQRGQGTPTVDLDRVRVTDETFFWNR